MEKTPDAGARLTFADTETGVMAGVWHVALAGYKWRDDVRPLSAGGKVQVDDPPDRSWWLVPRDVGARRYAYLKQVRVLSDFHALSVEPTRAAIVRFANRYGPLGSEQALVPRREQAAGPVVLTIGGAASSFGESLRDWQTELLAFRNLWSTWRSVRTLERRDSEPESRVARAERAIKDQIEWEPGGPIVYHHPHDPPGASLRSWRILAHPADQPSYDDITSNLALGDLVAAARFHVATELNRRLRGHLNPHVLPFVSSKLRFFPDSLLSAIYVRFVFEVAEGVGRTRSCEGCAQPFEPRRRDQRFCGKNCRERAGYRRRSGDSSSERDRS